jgi:hypothetical protein
MGLILNLKNVCVFFTGLRFKNVSPKTFGPRCIHTFQARIQNFSLSEGLYVRLCSVYA